LRSLSVYQILSAGLIVLATTPVLVAILAISHFSEQAASQQALQAQQQTAINVANDTRIYLDAYKSALDSIGNETSFTALSPSDQAAAMKGLRATDVTYFETFDVDGAARARSDAGSLERLNPGTVSRVVSDGVAVIVVGQFLAILVPMVDEAGTPVGMIGAFIPTNTISVALAKANTLPDQSVWVLDSSDSVIAAPNHLAPPLDPSQITPGQTASLFLVTDQDLYVAGYAPVQSQGWTIETLIRADMLQMSIREARVVDVAILVVTVTLAGIAGALLAQVFARPLQQLDRAERLLSTGDAHARLPDSSVREIASLSRAFGETRAKLADRTREREVALRDAQQALVVREEFLSIAAHELKTPITVLRGFAQLAAMRLNQPKVDVAQIQAMMQSIDAQTRRITSLIENLLDVSRLERGQFTISPEHVDLRSVINQADWANWPVIDTTRLRVEMPGHPVVTNVDPLRIEQLVTNLLSNAVKYSPEDSPIEVRLVELGDHLELSVRDHGAGIEPSKQEHLFERFFQAHGDSHRSGMGLGLFISRQIVHAHGGEIRAEFPDDGGSRFVVTLPR